MKKINSLYVSLLTIATLGLGACSNNDNDYVQPTVPENLGLYVLNEGNYGSTNAGIGKWKVSDGSYSSVSANIGDTGNDIGRYGSKLYVVINGGAGSNGKVLVLDASTSEEIGEIPVVHPRYIEFYKGKAYLTHGDNQLSQIDTGASAVSVPTITNTIEVGQTPEQLTIFKDKIYVANSGALSAQGYDNHVYVVNLPSFSIDRQIEVADNITSIHADTVNNTLYVNASAIYDGENISSPSKLYAVNTSTDAKTPFTFGAEQMFISGTAAMLISSNKPEGQYNIMFTNDIQSQQFTDNVIANSDIENPYGLTYNPDLGIIAIADAKDYTTGGELFLYSLYNGSFLLYSKVSTGILPKKVATQGWWTSQN